MTLDGLFILSPFLLVMYRFLKSSEKMDLKDLQKWDTKFKRGKKK